MMTPRMLLLAACLAVLPSFGIARAQFGQILLELGSARPFTYRYSAHENCLELALKNTLARELSALDLYDERLVKRVVVKELEDGITLIKIFLKNRDTVAVVQQLEEPFRISIDLFDKGYQDLSHSYTHSAPTDAALDAVLEDLPLSEVGDGAISVEGAHDSGAKAGATLPNKASPNENLKKKSGAQGQAVQEKASAQALFGSSARWRNLPAYIYRNTVLQTALIPEEDRIDVNGARAAAIALINQGFKDFAAQADEKAKHALDEALKLDSNLFTEHPRLLWTYAELNLAFEQLELAKGYYQALIGTFPGSLEAQYARIRQLDVRSVFAVGNHKKIFQLSDELAALSLEQRNAEIDAMLQIRAAYWSDLNGELDLRAGLPKVDSARFHDLRGVLESSKSFQDETRFLMEVMILNHMTSPELPWQSDFGVFANDFFNKHKDRNLPHVEGLKERLKERLVALFQTLGQAKDQAGMIAAFEGLPKPLQSIKKSVPVAWLVAEAYRSFSKYAAASEMYATASELEDDAELKFTSHFQVAYLSHKGIKQQILTKDRYAPRAYDHDRRALKLWRDFETPARQRLGDTLKSALLDSTLSTLPFQTASFMLLELMEKNGVAPTVLDPSATANETLGQQQGSKAIRIIQKLADIFSKLNLMPQRKRTMELLQQVKPSEITEPEAQLAWATELSRLADEYRRSNDYLKAGQLYKFTAEQSVNWDKKVESLYKGALLLLRSGKRDEAMTALNTACGDSNNVYYQALSCERLAQLENQ